MKFYYDLHLHSALSPCGDDDMTPCNIVGMAMLKGLDAIAVTDHNSAANVRAVAEASARFGGPVVVPGMELETSETIHLVCLFPSVDAAERFGAFVRLRLPAIPNRPEIFGAQRILSSEDEPIGEEKRLLINSTTIGLAEAVREVRCRGGVCYPAHVDREANGILAILGEIPRELGFASVEISPIAPKELQKALSFDYNLFCGSDAHYLENISERERFYEADHPGANALLRLIATPVRPVSGR